MHGVAGHDDALGHAVAGADHQIVAVEAQLFDRKRKERQIPWILRGRQGQVLDERRSNGMPFDGLGHRAPCDGPA